jgi:O-antigen ligase
MDIREIRMPLLFLGLLAALISLQLVPLPPGLWQSLPGRGALAKVYSAAGLGSPWFSLAMVPERALNSLLSLNVPLAVLLNFVIQPPERREDLLIVVWLLAFGSAILGMLQLLGSPSGPLYLYRITNNGLPVGLFSNRNHQAVMIAVGILLAGYIVARSLLRPRPHVPLIIAAAGSVAVFLPFLLITGSRAGLVLGLAMLFAAAAIVSRALANKRGRAGKSLLEDKRIRLGALAGFVVIVAGAIAAIVVSRSLALDRLLGKSIELDLRARVLPTVVDMAKYQFPAGSGFGSFDALYRQNEPTQLLMPAYLNHAHNDWIEFLLEGGLPGALLLAAFLIWLAQLAFWTLWTNRPRFALGPTTCVLIVLIFGLASLVDYPLRTPSLLSVFAMAAAMLTARRADQMKVAYRETRV